MLVLQDDDSITHYVIVDDYRWDRMCELREPLRSARPGERANTTHVNCIRCVAESRVYMRAMYNV